MILGILSDTHGFFHPALPEAFAGVDLILHAGDVGTPEVLERLEALAPVHAVYGNIDGPELRRRLPAELWLTLDGLRIWMTHIGGRPGRWAPGIAARLRQERPDVFICGHSHILRIERVPSLDGMLYLNPGAAGREGFHRVKTCVRLHLADGRARQAEVVHLDEIPEASAP
ncbi:phosphodiesterase, MJ0936 family [Rhodothermus marinus SG0.5JP17-172]|uniref:metallophosphoesterase family protein n=1 Tax=Rhodothermus marinus TaxID=29549 RepID=UPI000223DD7B|nr:metallophosphoesterase family protein [Rhodothermus marinus]AEN72219.1 phosphodiesterase, MJ0936 family [Rhodothermus marinus SG0.5JP17-172]MBO2491830.1 metallophosphoesterase [Rhodothermus marinus]